jgi:hypothetical protein
MIDGLHGKIHQVWKIFIRNFLEFMKVNFPSVQHIILRTMTSVVQVLSLCASLSNRQFNVTENTISYILRNQAVLRRRKILLISDLVDLGNDMLFSMLRRNGIENMMGMEGLKSVLSMRGC